MALAVVPYDIQIDHDGRKYRLHISALSLPKCAECGAMVIDDVAADAIDREFRKEAKLLSPEDIRAERAKLELTQQQLADRLGIASATISRWETGAQVQQRFHDRILRAFFALRPLREFLATTESADVAAI
jgi:putative zinc finger/helix-turn-helix YgiT family protein